MAQPTGGPGSPVDSPVLHLEPDPHTQIALLDAWLAENEPDLHRSPDTDTASIIIHLLEGWQPPQPWLAVNDYLGSNSAMAIVRLSTV